MKKLKICLLVAPVLAFASCADEIANVAGSESAIDKCSVISRSGQSLNPGLAYIDSIYAPENWQRYASYEERLSALNLPQELIDGLTTDQLAECCFNYPLFNNFLFFDDLQKGLDYVVDNFNGFKELKARGDYAQSIIASYSAVNMQIQTLGLSKSKSAELIASKYKRFFLESLLLSGYYPDVFASSNSHKLCSMTASLMLAESGEEKTMYGKCHDKFLQRINGDLTFLRESAERESTREIYTLFGSLIELRIMAEGTDIELSYLNNVNGFPNAEIVGPPSLTYNCHFYSWVKMNGSSEKYWMDPFTLFGDANVSQYWTNDEYYESNSSNYDKVVYGNIEHSASKSTVKGKVISKWGPGPVVIHDILDCPYAKSKVRYYKRFESTGVLSTSYGIYETTVGSVDRYFMPSTAHIPLGRMTLVWVIETAKGDDAVELGRAKIHKQEDTSISVEFTQTGLYEIYLRGYNFQGACVLNYGFEPIVI